MRRSMGLAVLVCLVGGGSVLGAEPAPHEMEAYWIQSAEKSAAAITEPLPRAQAWSTIAGYYWLRDKTDDVRRALKRADDFEGANRVLDSMGEKSAAQLGRVKAAAAFLQRKDKFKARKMCDQIVKHLDEGGEGMAAETFKGRVMLELTELYLALDDGRTGSVSARGNRVPEFRAQSLSRLGVWYVGQDDRARAQTAFGLAVEAVDACAFQQARQQAELASALAEVQAKGNAATMLKKFDELRSESPAALLIAAEAAALLEDPEMDHAYAEKALKAHHADKEPGDISKEVARVAIVRAGEKDPLNALRLIAEIKETGIPEHRPTAARVAGTQIGRAVVTKDVDDFVRTMPPGDAAIVAAGIASGMYAKQPG